MLKEREKERLMMMTLMTTPQLISVPSTSITMLSFEVVDLLSLSFSHFFKTDPPTFEEQLLQQ